MVIEQTIYSMNIYVHLIERKKKEKNDLKVSDSQVLNARKFKVFGVSSINCEEGGEREKIIRGNLMFASHYELNKEIDRFKSVQQSVRLV